MRTKGMWRSVDTKLIEIVSVLPERSVRALTHLGRVTSPGFWAAYIALAVLASDTTPQFRGELGLVLIALPLAGLLKLFIQRNRPETIFAASMKIKSYSFPSSHAYAALLGSLYITSLTIGTVVSAVIMIVGVLVGVSRVRIGAHYPTDVMAGWLLAAVVFLAIKSL